MLGDKQSWAFRDVYLYRDGREVGHFVCRTDKDAFDILCRAAEHGKTTRILHDPTRAPEPFAVDFQNLEKYGRRVFTCDAASFAYFVATCDCYSTAPSET